MIHVICLTKQHNELDFNIWYEWYKELGCKIHILDNESTIEIKSKLRDGDTYERIEGWANQWKLFTDICMDNRYHFLDGDDICFVDDDEYYWFDSSSNLSFEELLQKEYNQLDCVLFPQILISTKKVQKTRDISLIEYSTYRRNDLSSQGKSIFKYRTNTKYKFFTPNNKENGHVPWINGSRISDVKGPNGFGCSKTTYGLTYYDNDIRLYHYHIKSLDDWEIKFKRGSAAVDHQWYDKNIKNNSNYGNYNIPDLSMLNHPNYLKIKEKIYDSKI